MPAKRALEASADADLAISRKRARRTRRSIDDALSEHLRVQIFRQLEPADLAVAARVSRTWHRLTNDPEVGRPRHPDER